MSAALSNNYHPRHHISEMVSLHNKLLFLHGALVASVPLAMKHQVNNQGSAFLEMQVNQSDHLDIKTQVNSSNYLDIATKLLGFTPAPKVDAKSKMTKTQVCAICKASANAFKVGSGTSQQDLGFQIELACENSLHNAGPSCCSCVRRTIWSMDEQTLKARLEKEGAEQLCVEVNLCVPSVSLVQELAQQAMTRAKGSDAVDIDKNAFESVMGGKSYKSRCV